MDGKRDRGPKDGFPFHINISHSDFSLFLLPLLNINMSKTPVPIFVLMGTAGCGKTSVATEMQKILNCHYLEGDSLHPQSNVDKMAAGKLTRKRGEMEENPTSFSLSKRSPIGR